MFWRGRAQVPVLSAELRIARGWLKRFGVDFRRVAADGAPQTDWVGPWLNSISCPSSR